MKLPLKYEDYGQIEDKNDNPVALHVEDDDAAYIVKACNLYPELVEALRFSHEAISGFPRSLGYKITHLPRIEEVLKKANEDK